AEVRIPIFVNRLSGGSSLRLELCLRSPDTPASPGAATGGKLIFVDMLVGGVFRTPATRSLEPWRGFFTAYQPGSAAVLPTVESQAFVPIPRRLRVTAKLAKNRRSVLFRGTLVWAGRVARGASVQLIRVQRVRGGFRFPIVARTTTKRGGKFSFRKAISKTTVFIVFSPPQATSCVGQSSAPGGCVTATVSDTFAILTVKVPRKRR
ncbi:MAG: hypothetical protein M3M94_05725, partial [Actinomycetota bacterium]|nr:hypothetical protein [Actinomycetota bacterium]